MNRIKKIACFIGAVALVLLLWPIQDIENINTRRFCAYGNVYVEFERNGNVWGTIYIGPNGKPVTCGESENVREPVKEII
jgi:hypothetical protein